MIVSASIGWASLVASSTAQPALTVGIAACLLVLANTARATATYVTRSWQRRSAALERIEALAREVDQIRSQHFTKRSEVQNWSGWRRFVVDRKVRECDGCHSFYFRPCDGRSIASFHPGQYLTFSLPIRGHDKPVVRCYSLSDAPGRPYYRCTIKKVRPANETLPPGISSTFFNDQLNPGDNVDVKAPRGKFYLDLEKPGPVVLLAGGVGITPVLSMLNAIVEQEPIRETHFFLGVRNSEDHLFRDHLEQFRGQRHSRVRVHVCYSRPLPSNVVGRDYDFPGRITVELLDTLGLVGHALATNYDYFMCGPIPFMDGLKHDLQQSGVGPQRIHLEAFGGPKPIATKSTETRPAETKPKPTSTEPTVASRPSINFLSSGRQLNWDPTYENLLNLAEAHGIEIESGCRAGNCGTCAVTVKTGTVNYPSPPDREPETGMCLPCVGIPDGPIELDA